MRTQVRDGKLMLILKDKTETLKLNKLLSQHTAILGIDRKCPNARSRHRKSNQAQSTHTSGIPNAFKMGQIYILSSLCYKSSFLGEGKLEMRVEARRTWSKAGCLALCTINMILSIVSSSSVNGSLFFPKSYAKEALWLFLKSAQLTQIG